MGAAAGGRRGLFSRILSQIFDQPRWGIPIHAWGVVAPLGTLDEQAPSSSLPGVSGYYSMLPASVPVHCECSWESDEGGWEGGSWGGGGGESDLSVGVAHAVMMKRGRLGREAVHTRALAAHPTRQAAWASCKALCPVTTVQSGI